MAEDARRAVDQQRLGSEQAAALQRKAQAEYTRLIGDLVPEFLAGTRELGIHPTKLPGSRRFDPKYFVVSVSVNYGTHGDPHLWSCGLLIEPSGSWHIAPQYGKSRELSSGPLTADLEEQMRRCFTQALTRLAKSSQSR
jgi:hypothetical protein